MKTTRIYHPWNLWECYAHGMYDGESAYSVEKAKEMYAEFLRDIPLFRASMQRVGREWPISCEHFLTNDSINRLAWLGQAAMSIHSGVSRRHRSGYMLLSNEERKRANQAAAEFLSDWLRSHARANRRLHTEVEKHGLFS